MFDGCGDCNACYKYSDRLCYALIVGFLFWVGVKVWLSSQLSMGSGRVMKSTPIPNRLYGTAGEVSSIFVVVIVMCAIEAEKLFLNFLLAWGIFSIHS